MDKTINIVLSEDRPEYLLSIKDVETDNLVINLKFNDDLLAEYCQTYQLEQFSKLEAEIKASAWRSEGIKLIGQVIAEYTQNSIVSLKPIPKNQSFEFTRTFLPPSSEPNQQGTEIEIDPLEDDPPDNLIDGKLALGAIILENFALELDLYPRLEGEVLDAQYQADDTAGKEAQKTNPFSALKDFKTKDNS